VQGARRAPRWRPAHDRSPGPPARWASPQPDRARTVRSGLRAPAADGAPDAPGRWGGGQLAGGRVAGRGVSTGCAVGLLRGVRLPAGTGPRKPPQHRGPISVGRGLPRSGALSVGAGGGVPLHRGRLFPARHDRRLPGLGRRAGARLISGWERLAPGRGCASSGPSENLAGPGCVSDVGTHPGTCLFRGITRRDTPSWSARPRAGRRVTGILAPSREVRDRRVARGRAGVPWLGRAGGRGGRAAAPRAPPARELTARVGNRENCWPGGPRDMHAFSGARRRAGRVPMRPTQRLPGWAPDVRRAGGRAGQGAVPGGGPGR